MIERLSSDPAKNANEVTGWVMNKEKHAENIQQRMLSYFLSQRVSMDTKKKDPELYAQQLEACHAVIADCGSNEDLSARKLRFIVCDDLSK